MKDPPEGKTTAIIAMMRGKPNDVYHQHHSNKHYKQKLVQVLLDAGSSGNLFFVNKDNPCCFSLQKGWFHNGGILQMGYSTLSVKLE